MIKVFKEGNVTVPMFVCDICNKPITDGEMAVAVFQNLPLLDGIETAEVLHAHKGRCHDVAEKRLGKTAGFDELTNHCRYLLNNASIKL
ncbi:hypothetical protein VB712_16215 [Spirulina sp. CCNP1310]|uniref:hypothetical protein n=1 Tax=Spirulina sp. CCNP1310 TaxID=3110249 RepID=UPI002B20C09F|nr:hypothetical protein [Spirulina sp. CCNP1310]MEA5420778.1 hypothetical protein [Spirulina sp. CCNP1310]